MRAANPRGAAEVRPLVSGTPRWMRVGGAFGALAPLPLLAARPVAVARGKLGPDLVRRSRSAR